MADDCCTVKARLPCAVTGLEPSIPETWGCVVGAVQHHGTMCDLVLKIPTITLFFWMGWSLKLDKNWNRRMQTLRELQLLTPTRDCQVLLVRPPKSVFNSPPLLSTILVFSHLVHHFYPQWLPVNSDHIPKQQAGVWAGCIRRSVAGDVGNQIHNLSAAGY